MTLVRVHGVTQATKQHINIMSSFFFSCVEWTGRGHKPALYTEQT